MKITIAAASAGKRAKEALLPAAWATRVERDRKPQFVIRNIRDGAHAGIAELSVAMGGHCSCLAASLLQ
jgi:hypothetical protein